LRTNSSVTAAAPSSAREAPPRISRRRMRRERARLGVARGTHWDTHGCAPSTACHDCALLRDISIVTARWRLERQTFRVVAPPFPP
jgi:hypothetical protein